MATQDPAGQGTARLCPSTSAENATVFLGMITPAGRVAYVTPAMPLSREDVESLPSADGLPLEAQYRFAGPCVESGCAHWSGTQCRLGARMADAGEELDDTGERLPKCAIRPRCRWYGDQGARACRGCAYVVTDLRGGTGASRSPAGGPGRR